MARETYTLEEQPTYQETVEKLLDSDPVKAEGSFLETLLLRILNNIKAAYQKAIQAENSIGTAQSSLAAHINNKENPHGTTAAQVGADPAGSAAGVQANLTAHEGDAVKHITAEERTAWNGKANAADLTAHINNKSNPHGVTAGQTGALPLSGGTMTGSLKAMSSPAVGTAQVRNIYAGTSDMTAGSSTLATGTIYLVYE